MSNSEVKLTAAAACHAAHVIVEVWRQMGEQTDDYDLVWRAKEYLLNCSDKMP